MKIASLRDESYADVEAVRAAHPLLAKKTTVVLAAALRHFRHLPDEAQQVMLGEAARPEKQQQQPAMAAAA